MRSTLKNWRTQMEPRPAFLSRPWRPNWRRRSASCAIQNANRFLPNKEDKTMQTMKANVFRGPNKIGDRVLVGAITPCGQCRACLSGQWAQCGHGEGVEAIGGWRFGNTINGAQAEYLLVPNAQANLAKIPDDLTDEQVVLLADIASTGISAAESGKVQIGDTVAVFAQGPIGLCATAGAKLKGAGFIIAVESDSVRAAMAQRMGADVVVDHSKTD